RSARTAPGGRSGRAGSPGRGAAAGRGRVPAACAGPRRRPSRPAPAAPAGRWTIRRSRATLPSLRATSAALQFIRVGNGGPKKSGLALPLGAVASGVRGGEAKWRPPSVFPRAQPPLERNLSGTGKPSIRRWSKVYTTSQNRGEFARNVAADPSRETFVARP